MHPGPTSLGSQGGAQTWCEEQKVWTWWGCREVSGPPVDKDITQPQIYPQAKPGVPREPREGAPIVTPQPLPSSLAAAWEQDDGQGARKKG